MTRHFIFLLSTTVLFSCNNPKTSINEVNKGIKPVEFPYLIDIEKNLEKPMTVPLSSIGKALEYIPLETKKSSLIGEINQIEISTKYIFVYTNRPSKMLQFDRKGKFIRQIGANGRGPGEYIGVMGFCIDQKNEKIFISNKDAYALLEYNFNGEYIRTIKFFQKWESIQFQVYDTIGFAFYLFDDRGFSIHSKFNLYVTDYAGNLLFNIKRHLIRKSNAVLGKVPLYDLNGILHFKQYAVDTLYTLKNEKTEPYAIFNLGKEKMDPNLLFTLSNRIEIKKQIENKIEIGEILENGEYLFTRLALGMSDSSKYCIFNKQTSEITILKNNGFTNDLDGGILFWPKFVYNNDSILIDYCGSDELLKYIRNNNSKELRKKFGEKYDRLEKISNEVDEMSNPILIILH